LRRLGIVDRSKGRFLHLWRIGACRVWRLRARHGGRWGICSWRVCQKGHGEEGLRDGQDGLTHLGDSLCKRVLARCCMSLNMRGARSSRFRSDRLIQRWMLTGIQIACCDCGEPTVTPSTAIDLFAIPWTERRTKRMRCGL